VVKPERSYTLLAARAAAESFAAIMKFYCITVTFKERWPLL